MIHLIKTMNGGEYEVSQKERDALATLITGKKDDRPAFIELRSSGAIIATASIQAIVKHRREPERLPTTEEEMAEFNREWEKNHPEQKGAI